MRIPVTKVGPSARYFEDFAPGDEFLTQGRTIGDADNTIWTMFSGDMNPMHVDNEYAREFGMFGGRFPAGLMVVAVASGLQERMGLFQGTGLAMISQSIDYHTAVLLGDTIRVRMVVTECVPSRSKPAGKVTFRYEILRQDDAVCVSGDTTYYLVAHGTTSD
jgi:acyl dehydratase